MTAPLWVSQALNAHAATIRIDILLSMIPLLKSDRLPRPRRKCEIRTVRSRTLGNCHCARTAALIFVMAETRETYQPTRDTVFGGAGSREGGCQPFRSWCVIARARSQLTSERPSR